MASSTFCCGQVKEALYRSAKTVARATRITSATSKRRPAHRFLPPLPRERDLFQRKTAA